MSLTAKLHTAPGARLRIAIPAWRISPKRQPDSRSAASSATKDEIRSLFSRELMRIGRLSASYTAAEEREVKLNAQLREILYG